MAERKTSVVLFAAGIFVFLCGLLMCGIQLHGRLMHGEKLQLGVAATFLSLGAVLVALSHRRMGARQNSAG